MIKSARADEASLDLSGKSVVIAGRLETIGRRVAIDLVKARGGTVRRSLSRFTGCLVVGHDAAGLIENGGLRARIEAADRNAVPCLSENGFLRAIERDQPARKKGREREALPFSAEDIQRTAGLAGDDLRILGLLDIIDLDEGRGGFEAMVAARQAARLLRGGCTLAAIAASAARMRRRAGGPSDDRPRSAAHDNPLSCHHFDLDDQGAVVLRIGDHLAEACGQLRLPLLDPGNPSIDTLMNRAEAAEDAGEWSAAEALYRRCAMLDRHDPTAPFNLANILREQGRPREASLFFRLALARDQNFAEAWYNLGHMAEAAGGVALACDCIERALRCDPAFADAAFNLARLRYGLGDFVAAASCWKLYIELDPDSAWTRKARHGLALCRRQLADDQ